MTRYIKADDAIYELKREFPADYFGKIARCISRIPTADAVEIKKKGEWEMFDLISSAYYGKGMYFKQNNGMVYSRYSGKYMSFDEAIREFVSLIDDSIL